MFKIGNASNDLTFTLDSKELKLTPETQLAFYLNLYWTVIRPSGFLTDRIRSEADLSRMLTGERRHIHLRCGILNIFRLLLDICNTVIVMIKGDLFPPHCAGYRNLNIYFTHTLICGMVTSFWTGSPYIETYYLHLFTLLVASRQEERG